MFLAPLFILCLYNYNYSLYLLIIFIVLLGFYEVFNCVKQKFLIIFLNIILILFSYSLVKLRGSNIENYIEICWILSVVWLSDIGGYIVGKLIGGKKLTKYSPQKTISGFVGSILFSQFAILIPFFYMNNFSLSYFFFILQFFLCIVTVLGDIFFSYVKRLNNIKDYSKIIPGHGGILDRIDGLIFVIIFYFIFKNL